MRSTKAGSAEPATQDAESARGSWSRRIGEFRSTKAGSAEPATPVSRVDGLAGSDGRSLNEGRLGRAGNSSSQLAKVTLLEVATFAQRRPARPSRQLYLLEPSTQVQTRSWRISAQRRPARPSRQLPQATSLHHGPEPSQRSTKAGSAEPATPGRRPGRVYSAGVVGRSTKAGSAEPATPHERPMGRRGRVPRSCAQRRPARPSRQLCRLRTCGGMAVRPRSTSLNEGRLGRAGNSRRSASPRLCSLKCRGPLAQRRPARPSRQLPRLLAVSVAQSHGTVSLNEGRLGRAGNSAPHLLSGHCATVATEARRRKARRCRKRTSECVWFSRIT